MICQQGKINSPVNAYIILTCIFSVVGLVVFLPAYGLLLRQLSGKFKVSATVQKAFKDASKDLVTK